MFSPATDWMSDIAGNGFGLLPSSSFTVIPLDLLGRTVVVAMAVELLTRGAKLKLVTPDAGGSGWVPLLLGDGGSSPLWFLLRLEVVEDPVVRFLLGGATGPEGGGIFALTSAEYTAVDPDAN